MADIDRYVKARTDNTPTLEDIFRALTRTNIFRGNTYADAYDKILAAKKKDADAVFTAQRQQEADQRAARELDQADTRIAETSRSNRVQEGQAKQRIAQTSRQLDQADTRIANQQSQHNEELAALKKHRAALRSQEWARLNIAKDRADRDAKLQEVNLQIKELDRQIKKKQLAAGPRKSAFAEKLDILKGHFDEETAAKIAGGVLKVATNPISGKSEIIDLVTKKSTPLSDDQADAVNSVGASGDGVKNLAVPTNMRAAFGSVSVPKMVLNKIASFFHADKPYEEANNARVYFDNFRTYAAITMSQDFPGRPSVYTMERAEGLIAEAGAWLTDPGNALRNLMQVRTRMVNQLAEREKILPTIPVRQRPRYAQIVADQKQQLRVLGEIIKNWGPAVARSKVALIDLARELDKDNEDALKAFQKLPPDQQAMVLNYGARMKKFGLKTNEEILGE